MMKTAEGAVSSTVDILKTLKEKVIGAANDDKTDSDRLTIQKELNQSIDQIDDNALVTFNGKYLVDGSKNTIGESTYTALTNQKLLAGTDGNTKLTDLRNRNDESLEIATTDKITVSYVSQGKTYSTTFQAGKDSTLQTIFDKAEAIDLNSNIFAGKDNKSVYAAKRGVSDASQLSTDMTYQSMTAEAGSAEGFLAAYGVAADNLAKAAANVVSAANALITAANAESAQTTTAPDMSAGSEVGVLNVNSEAVGSVFSSAATVSNVKDALAYIDARKQFIAADGASSTITVSGTDSNTNTVGGNLTHTVTVTQDRDISSALNALISAVSKYNGYNIASSDDASAVTKVGVSAASDQADTATVSTSSALAAFNALDNGDYSAFTTARGFGSDNDGVFQSELGAGSDYYSMANLSGSGVAANYTTVGSGVVAGGADAGLSIIGGGDVVSGRVMAMAAYASELNRSALLTDSNVGVAGSNDMVNTADGTAGITITANKDGIGGQIAGFNISVTDSEGNVKKSVNASLDSWTETVRAQNKSADNAISLHVGAAANQSIKVGLTDMRSEALGLKGADGTKLNISTQTKANAAINVLDNAIQKALDQQTTIGSVESRLEYTSSNLTTSSENVQASESTIRDADMAREMTEYTKNNVLLQAAQSMLAQANQNSSAVLSLLQ